MKQAKNRLFHLVTLKILLSKVKKKLLLNINQGEKVRRGRSDQIIWKLQKLSLIIYYMVFCQEWLKS